MSKFTDTQKLVYAMLTENTGSHMLDSGGAYGRNWSRNQAKTIEDFNNEQPQAIEKSEWTDKDGETHTKYERTVSVFHYLSELELDHLCEEFNQKNTDCKDWEGDSCCGVSQAGADFLELIGCDVISKLMKSKCQFNTYNGDSDLSQILQGAWLDMDGEMYLLLQIHGGCDARGGYTDAKLFKVQDDWMIHPYLQEYMDSGEIEEELEYLNQ
tara:strand:+ start:596 stop:1231 length:636 start_codon:yes stop_codon:yes gene_type:complete